MHQPPYTPSQGQPLPPDMHGHPHQSPYLPQQISQHPSMPPPGPSYQDSVSMAGPGPLQQQGPPTDGASSSLSQSQERTPLTADEKRQQEINLKPYSSEDDQSRVYA